MNSWKLDIPDLDRRDLPNTPPIYPVHVVEENQQKILHLSDVHLQLDYKVRRHRFYSSFKAYNKGILNKHANFM